MKGTLARIFWEYPVTASFCLVILLFSSIIALLIPNSILNQYFYSHPGSFNPINWILSVLVHGSLSHLFWNVCFLFVLGRAVEEKVGTKKWLLYFFMAAIVSGCSDSIVRGVQSDRVPAIGASGAIAGIASVAALLSPYNIKFSQKNIPFPVFLIAWVMLYSDFVNLFRNDNVAHWAHIGGFFSVFIVAYFLSPEDKAKLKTGFYLNLVFFILTVILLYLIQNR